MDVLEVKVFLVLMLFCVLFLGGGILIANGLLAGKKKQLWWGIVLTILSLLMTALGLADRS